MNRTTIRQMFKAIRQDLSGFGMDSLYSSTLQMLSEASGGTRQLEFLTLPPVEFEALEGETTFEKLLEQTRSFLEALGYYREEDGIEDLLQSGISVFRQGYRISQARFAEVVWTIADAVEAYLPHLPGALIAHRPLREAIEGVKAAHTAWRDAEESRFIVQTLLFEIVGRDNDVDALRDALISQIDHMRTTTDRVIPSEQRRPLNLPIAVGELRTLTDSINLLFTPPVDHSSNLLHVVEGLQTLASQLSRTARFSRCAEALSSYADRLDVGVKELREVTLLSEIEEYLDELGSEMDLEQGRDAIQVTMPKLTLKQLRADLVALKAIDSEETPLKMMLVSIPLFGDQRRCGEFVDALADELIGLIAPIARPIAEQQGLQFQLLPNNGGYIVASSREDADEDNDVQDVESGAELVAQDAQ